jgi:tetratricopeptide (TPR) repeat protein
LDWTNGQHRRRVLERNALHTSAGDTPLQDAINEALYSEITADLIKQNDRILEESNTEINDEADIDYVEPLINHRKALLRSQKFSFSKAKGNLGFDAGLDDSEEEDDDMIRDDLLPTKDYMMDLQKTFAKHMDASPNNYKVKQLYQHAKYADQAGDRESAKTYLLQLRQVAPQDTRVIRRLARLEMQEGKVHIAREILQSGLRSMPKNGDMLQGLGQLELKCGNTQKARTYFKDAIVASPKFPNPYHALATLEHSAGNIRIATTILRTGLKHCPTNHRLHHALGDLYREAQMLDLAEKAYLKGLKCIEAEAEESGRSLDWGKSFLFSALSYISYDKGDITECRNWLRKSVEMGNNRMHSQGW